MDTSTPEARWLPVGLDDDGAPLFIDPSSVKTHGLRLDGVEVTVIVRPVEGSEGLRALQEVLSKSGKSSEGNAYVEQSWILNLPGRLFGIRSLRVKSKEGITLYSASVNGNDLSAIEPGSAADHVSRTTEQFVQEQSVVLQRPDVSQSAEHYPARAAAPEEHRRLVTPFDVVEEPRGSVPSTVHELSFKGSGSDLFSIDMVNHFLTAVTLGFYSFWGRVKVRKYLLRETEFGDDRFAYHGTGGELLRGWLKAMLVFGLPIVLLRYIPKLTGSGMGVGQLLEFLSSLIVLLFIPMATVGAWRYRLSRSSWREIRFSFRGKTWDFVKIYIPGMLLTAVTLGLYKPFFDTRTHSFIVSHSYFGNRVFRFDGDGHALFPLYLRAYLLTIPTLGLYWFWYFARKQRFYWEHTSFGPLRFSSTVTGGALLRLHGTNLLLLIVTLGLAWPWIKVRKMQFLFEYLRARGAFDAESIVQEARTASPTGEALASFFDLDFDLG